MLNVLSKPFPSNQETEKARVTGEHMPPLRWPTETSQRRTSSGDVKSRRVDPHKGQTVAKQRKCYPEATRVDLLSQVQGVLGFDCGAFVAFIFLLFGYARRISPEAT